MPADPPQYWDRLAAAWDSDSDRREPALAPLTDWLLDEAAIGADDDVLDLAAGNGELGLLAADRARRVTITDLSAGMLETARRRGADRQNVDYRVADAQRLELPDRSFDAVLCRFGFMLLEDPGAALREARRVLRGGGRLAFGVWAEAGENPFIVAPASVFVERGLVARSDAGPGMFALARPEAIEALVTGAGFEPPRIQRLELTFRFAAEPDLWRFVSQTAGSLAEALEQLDERGRAEIREAVVERCAAFRDGDGYAFPAVALAVASISPGTARAGGG